MNTSSISANIAASSTASSTASISAPPLTAESILDFWKCPKLWEHKHLAGLVPCVTDITDASSQAVETIAAKKAAVAQFMATQTLPVATPYPTLWRHVENGTSIEAAIAQLGNDMELHLVAVLFPETPQSKATRQAIVVLDKSPTTRRRKDETSSQFQARCLADIESDPAAHLAVVTITTSPDILSEAIALADMTEGIISTCISMWSGGNSNAFPGVRRGIRCGACEYKPLCWHGEVERYQHEDGSPIGEIDEAFNVEEAA